MQKTEAQLCMKCHGKPAGYQSVPCGCSVFCASCAMKLATGGKCKVRLTDVY